MATSRTRKKKAAKTPTKKKARARKQDKFGEAVKAARDVGAHVHELGRFSEPGTCSIDAQEILKLKAALKRKKIPLSRVKFVALNAPFKRRSPTSPA